MRELADDEGRAVVTIRQLQSAYGDAVTRRDWASLGLLLEPDATIHLDLRTGEPRELRGPDALVDFVDRALARFAFFALTILNTTVAVDGDEATGRMYICEVRLDHEGAWSEAYGLYRDRYRRRDGAWRIAARRYSTLARRAGDHVEAFPLPAD